MFLVLATSLPLHWLLQYTPGPSERSNRDAQDMSPSRKTPAHLCRCKTSILHSAFAGKPPSTAPSIDAPGDCCDILPADRMHVELPQTSQWPFFFAHQALQWCTHVLALCLDVPSEPLGDSIAPLLSTQRGRSHPSIHPLCTPAD